MDSPDVPKDIISTCTKLGKSLERCVEDEECIEYAGRALPNLLLNRPVFADILRNVVEGAAYPDSRRATMFDNELILYTDPSRLFSLRLFLWGPGEYTVIHDHNSWGVIGPVSGVLEVFNYSREDDGSKEGYARIVESERLKCLPGDTAFTLRLDKGIHKIGNPTADTIVSLSFYGNPIKRSYLQGFEIKNSRVYRILAPKTKKKMLAEESLKLLLRS